MRTSIGWIVASLMAANSVQAAPVEHDLAWLAASVDAPPGDTGRECLESAVIVLTATTAFRLGHTPDDVVRSALVSDVSDPGLLAARQAEADLWTKSHDPVAVSAEHLVRCVALDGVTLKNPAPAKGCLETLAPVMASQVDDKQVHEEARKLAACLTAGPGTARAPTRATGGCIVLLGGGGTQTGNAEVDGNWFRVNGAISGAVAAELAAKSYDVRPLIIEIADPSQRLGLLSSELSDTHCSKVVQISHLLRSADGAGAVNAFSIEADVLRLDTSNSRTVTPVSEYSKRYDFAMTAEVMQNLSVSALGHRIADEVVASGALPKP